MGWKQLNIAKNYEHWLKQLKWFKTDKKTVESDWKGLNIWNAYSILFQHIPAYSGLFQQIPAHFSQFHPILAYSCLFQPIKASSSLLQSVPAYSSPFHPVQAYSRLNCQLFSVNGISSNCLNYWSFVLYLYVLRPWGNTRYDEKIVILYAWDITFVSWF